MKIRRVICMAVMVLFAVTMTSQAQTAKVQADPRVAKALDAAKMNYKVTSLGNYRLDFVFANKRSQYGFIASRPSKYSMIEVRKVWAVAYKTTAEKLSAEFANRLLKQNVSEKIGAWEYSLSEDGNRVKCVARVSTTATPAELVAALRAVVHAADEMENRLTGDDQF